MNTKDFCSKYNITEDQFYGKEPIYSLELDELTTIPDGFNPIVINKLFLKNVTSIPDGFNPIVGNWLILSSVTHIPEGFSPIVGSWLDLSSVTHIPEGFSPIVGSWLDISSVANIPEGFNPIVGNWLVLSSATNIPEGFNPIVGVVCYFDESANKLIPFNNSKTEYQPLPLFQCDTPRGQFIKCDDKFSQVISNQGNLWRLKNIGGTREYYLVTDGEGNFAHGDTLEKANANLLFKTSDNDKSNCIGLNLDEKNIFTDCILIAR